MDKFVLYVRGWELGFKTMDELNAFIKREGLENEPYSVKTLD